MKKIILIVITIFISSSFINNISALSSYIVMDKLTGRVLDGENINEQMLIASTTKIMTSLVALENEDPTKVICAGEEINKTYGSMIYVDIGECMTLYDYLVGLLLRSGNDASMVIAENTLGYDKFIDKMNELARKIGMKNTIFKNPHGLDEETQNYSTAYDMALLMKYASNNKTFMEITSLKKYRVETNVETHLWYNKNKLLTSYKYATGGKIGYTTKSGHIFVSSASRGKESLIVVTMKDDNQFKTHENLYEKDFDKYDLYKVIDKYTFVIKEDYYKNYHLYVKDDVYIPLNKNELDKVDIKIEIIKKKKIKNNDIVGSAKIYVGSEFIKSENIYALGKQEKINKIKNWLYFWK